MGRLKVRLAKPKLQRLYHLKKYSTLKIASLYNCSPQTVTNRLNEYGIEIKSRSQARMKYRKKDFSGDKIEQAYLIGFRLGDLNVYQTNSDSDLVVARCHSTQQIQVELLVRLFSKYGKVTISKSDYGYNVNCLLNSSFLFLLEKSDDVPRWIEEKDNTVLAFIAGYTDAEGSFILNQNKARLKIDSYDSGILTWIKEQLMKLEIRIKFRKIASKNNPRSDSLKLNKDLWRLNVNESHSLFRLMRMLKPFLHHSNRLKQVEICFRNINHRIKLGTI